MACFGAYKVVHEANKGYFNRATRTELEFRTKKTSETTAYPFLVGFPHPIQLLLVDEIRAFQRRVEEGKPMPDHEAPECNCQFFRKYMLPCRHLFHRNLAGDFLTDEHWDIFQSMFEEMGLDVYVSRVQVQEEVQEDPLQRQAEVRRFEFYAVMEQVREHWFGLENEYRNGAIDGAALDELIRQIRDLAA